MSGKLTIASIGDSQTDLAAGYGCAAWETWTPQLAARLVGGQARTFGLSGDTSAQGLARAGMLLRYDTPDIGVVSLGINDPNASISAATTTLNLRAMIMALKHAASGDRINAAVSVADVASLPASGLPGQRYVVLSDTSTTGGQAARQGQAATITGSATGPTVWENRYPVAGENGWGRVAVATTPPTGCKHVLVLGDPYANFTSGGDTPSTPLASRATIRAAQAAAATAEAVTVGGIPAVVFVDLYAFMRNRIVAGTDPDFSSISYVQARSWHVQENNQHLNVYGHALKAEAALQAAVGAWGFPTV